MTRAPSHTLVYDGHCQLCQRAIAAVRRMDPAQQIEIVASQEPGVSERFSAIPPTSFAEAMHLVAIDGTTWRGAAAMEELLRVLPRTRWFAPVFYIPLVRKLADWGYRWIARNRYRLGCGDHCTPHRQ